MIDLDLYEIDEIIRANVLSHEELEDLLLLRNKIIIKNIDIINYKLIIPNFDLEK